MNKLCTRAAALVFLAGAVASLASGCGGAAPMSEAPKAPGGAKADEAFEERTPEAALARLDAAERDLGRVLGLDGRERATVATGRAQAGPPPPPPPADPGQAPAQPSFQMSPTQAPPQAPAPTAMHDDKQAPARHEPCATACVALASMERAADHLCGLAGASDGRCASARERVKNATARVRAACPSCER